jgi:rSAM/selenodomain-associated transferase 2
MKISVIIPTWNEGDRIGALIKFIFDHGRESIADVIISDGGSDDNTVQSASETRAIVLRKQERSRASQMNAGARIATGDILYFIHADVKLIDSFANDIINSVRSGYHAGCYRYVFDSTNTMLRINSYCTRFDGIMCRGGDQTLFVLRSVFVDMNGFNPFYSIMEDYDFIIRLRKRYRFKIIPKSILVSARKYETNSWLRVQLANLCVFIMFFAGQTPEKMKSFYASALHYR